MNRTRRLQYREAEPRGRFSGRRGFGRAAGISAPPRDLFNLGLGIGDDPEAVQANRSALTVELGLQPDHLVFMSQVHGTNIADVTGPHSGPLPDTDGMVSATTDIGLAVLVADCVPVLARDLGAGVIGVAHAGRVGASAGIVPELIRAMVALGASSGSVQVVLGPAICGRCYEVPAHMRSEVDALLPGSACTTGQGTPGLDLRVGLARQLRSIGVGAVEIDERCTREDPHLFSHRRSAPTGRFAGVIRL